MSSLFAGKIHALLYRNWSRIKGRDLYDYLFYLARHAEVNMLNLKEKLADSGLISADTVLDKKYLTELLDRRFQNIDYNQAKNDVRPFLRNPDTIEIWDADFFISATHQYLSGVAFPRPDKKKNQKHINSGSFNLAGVGLVVLV